MFKSFQYRSQEIEIMDDLEMEGKELSDTLDYLSWINKWLGGAQVTIDALNQLKDLWSESTPLKIIDLGCGGGDTLQLIAKWGEKKGVSLNLLGIDANQYTLAYAANKSKQYSNINYQQMNIFAEEFSKLQGDIYICELFLHHFQEEEIIELLKNCFDNGAKAVIVNDLQRHYLPYYLFNALMWLLRAPKMVVEDGSLSVKKGFVRKDIKKWVKALNAKQYSLKWKWAFRYQLILEKEI